MSRLLPFFAFLALCGLFGFGIWWNSSHDQTAIPSPLINKPWEGVRSPGFSSHIRLLYFSCTSSISL